MADDLFSFQQVRDYYQQQDDKYYQIHRHPLDPFPLHRLTSWARVTRAGHYPTTATNAACHIKSQLSHIISFLFLAKTSEYRHRHSNHERPYARNEEGRVGSHKTIDRHHGRQAERDQQVQ